MTADALLDVPALQALLDDFADELEPLACTFDDDPPRADRQQANSDMVRTLSSRLPSLLRDGERLDAISQPGSRTRVATRAMANMADPPTRRFATVCIPVSPHASHESERPTLREAIDAARSAPETPE